MDIFHVGGQQQSFESALKDFTFEKSDRDLRNATIAARRTDGTTVDGVPVDAGAAAYASASKA